MPQSILIADDNRDDEETVRRMFAKAKILNPLQAVSTGAAALAYLRGEGVYANRTLYPYPVLLLLDLKMPGQTGFDVLKIIRTEAKHRSLCVVVLTGMGDIRDVGRAYQLGAHSFLTKPMGSEDFFNLVHGLKGISMRATGEGLELDFDRHSLSSHDSH